MALERVCRHYALMNTTRTFTTWKTRMATKGKLHCWCMQPLRTPRTRASISSAGNVRTTTTRTSSTEPIVARHSKKQKHVCCSLKLFFVRDKESSRGMALEAVEIPSNTNTIPNALARQCLTKGLTTLVKMYGPRNNQNCKIVNLRTW